MARRFVKVLEEEIEEAFFIHLILVNTKTTTPLRVGEERWIYTSTLRVSVSKNYPVYFKFGQLAEINKKYICWQYWILQLYNYIKILSIPDKPT